MLHTITNAHQSILVIFGRDIAKRVLSNGDLLLHLLTNFSALPGETRT